MRVKKLLEQFFDACLIEGNVEKALTFASEKIMSFGTEEQEIARNKMELRALLERETAAVQKEEKFSYVLADYRESEYGEGMCGAFCFFVTAVEKKQEGAIRKNAGIRLTACARKEEGMWKLVQLHMSRPMRFQEREEVFPLKYGHRSVGKIGAVAGRSLIQTMSSLLPGGILGVYLEPGFPLYVINDSMLSYLGYTYEELVEVTGEKIISIIAPEDRKQVEREIFQSVRDTGEYELQCRIMKKDGSLMWIMEKGHRIVTEDGREAIIGIILDNSKNMDLQEKLKREAIEDPLTGTLNRKGAAGCIRQSFMTDKKGTLFLLDIDNFKKVNDIYGHQAGDRVLMALANILKVHTRRQDTVSRMGGDEFLIYLSGCVAKNVVEDRARSIIEAFRLEGKDYPMAGISISIGVSMREKEESFQELYLQADQALYEAKRTGKGQYRLRKKEDAENGQREAL